MKRPALLFAVCIIAWPALSQGQTPDYSSAGRFGTAYRTEDIPGATETMRGSRIYFPDSSGAFPQRAVPAPIIVFGHGWQMGIDRYYSYAQHLASWGYVVCLPTISNPLTNPEHDKRARLMIDAARFVAALDTVSGDVFFGKLDRWNWGFTGHSMGGALSLLAADTFKMTDTLRAIVSLASPQSNPPTRARNLVVPKLIVPGGVDNIALWRDVRAAYWDSAPAPGTFAVIRGANHGYFMDNSYFWENGGTATITREAQLRISRRHITAWFERYLQDDRSTWNYDHTYGDSIWRHPSMDTVEIRPEQTGLEEGRNEPLTGLRVHPSVARDRVTLTYQLDRPGTATVAVRDAAGRLIARLEDRAPRAGTRRVDWDTQDSSGRPVPSGVYFLQLAAHGSSLALPVRIVR